MQKVSHVDFAAIAALWIGAMNWGFVGLFHFNIIEKLFGSAESWVTRLVYAVIGVAALYLAISSYVRESKAPNVIHTRQGRLSIG